MKFEIFEHQTALNTVSSSAYYSLSEFNKSFADNNRDLKLMHLNIRSLYPKMEEVSCFLEAVGFEFDLICFSETWLNDMLIGLVDLSGYIPYHVTRNDERRGGGVSVFVKNNYDCTLIDEFCYCNDSMECLFVNVARYDKTFIVGVIYRPPNCDVSSFLNMLESVLHIVYT